MSTFCRLFLEVKMEYFLEDLMMAQTITDFENMLEDINTLLAVEV